jgi:hypothetical protein
MASPNLATKKVDTVDAGVTLARDALGVINNANEWIQNLTSNGFQQNGANAIVQTDIPDPSTIVHMTPALLQQLRTALTALAGALTAAQMDNLRQVARGVVRAS